MGAIFISYRRQDSQATSDRIFDRLSQRFGRDKIVYDVESIPPGMDFAVYLGQTVRASSVVLVIMGAEWLTAAREGKRRLDEPEDFVRREIETALAQSKLPRGPIIIPLLLNGATMPSGADMPPSIAELANIQSLPVRRNPDFDTDMERLIRLITPLVVPPPAPPPSAPPPLQSQPTYAPGVPFPPQRPKRKRGWVGTTITITLILAILGGVGYGWYRFFGPGVLAGQQYPAGVTSAMIEAPVVDAIKQCTTAATSNPANCPQRLSDTGTHIVWTLHGDPAAGARAPYQGNNLFEVVGRYTMTVSYLGYNGPQYRLVSDLYDAKVTWDPAAAKATLASLDPYSSIGSVTLSVPRPPAITDVIAKAYTKAQFTACAAQKTYPFALICPQFTGPNTYNLDRVQFSLKGDPTVSARVGYESSTGFVHVVGTFVMDVTYYYNSGSPVTYEDNGNYDAYVTSDNGRATVIYIAFG